MNYNFKLKSGKIIRVFHNNFFIDEQDNEYGVVSWNNAEGSGKYEEVGERAHKDETGRIYFMYNKEKIYMDTFLALTPQEYLDKVNSDEWMSSDELTWTLMKYGLDCIRVIQPKEKMTGINIGGLFLGFESHRVGEDKSNWDRVEYKFVECDLHKLENNYKIKLVPLKDEHRGVYASRDFYISDLTDLFRKCKNDFTLKLRDDKVA